MKDIVEVIGAFILAILAVWFLVRLEAADTVIDTLKVGFVFLATVIQMSGVMSRGSK